MAHSNVIGMTQSGGQKIYYHPCLLYIFAETPTFANAIHPKTN
jgi:hypothetical protein